MITKWICKGIDWRDLWIAELTGLYHYYPPRYFRTTNGHRR
jgi:hypothetical protein